MLSFLALATMPFISLASYSTSLRIILYVQKWSKGKVREKLQNAVMFDQKLYDRLVAEVPKVREKCCVFAWASLIWSAFCDICVLH